MAEKKKGESFPIPKKSYSLEFLVGLFTLAGVAAFAYLAINIAQMRFLKTGYHNLFAEFSNVSGLKEGAQRY
jgi:ABC-type transporter Mla subunit MlaD